MRKPGQNVLSREAEADGRLPRGRGGLLVDVVNNWELPATPVLLFQAQLEGVGNAWANSPLVLQFSHPPPNSLVPYFKTPGCCVCFCLLLTLPYPGLVQAFMLPTLPHSSLLPPSHFSFAFHHPVSQILHVHGS